MEVVDWFMLLGAVLFFFSWTGGIFLVLYMPPGVLFYAGVVMVFTAACMTACLYRAEANSGSGNSFIDPYLDKEGSGGGVVRAGAIH